MITKSPGNLDALIYQIQSEMLQMKSSEIANDKTLLRMHSDRVRQMRMDKVGKMQERIQTDNVVESLKLKISELSLFRFIKAIEGKIKLLISSQKHSAQDKERQNERYLTATDEIAKSKTELLSDEAADLFPQLSTQGNVDVHSAMGASVQQIHENQKIANVQQSIQKNQINNMIENQKVKVQEQLDLIHKSKVFGFIFQMLNIICQIIPVTSVCFILILKALHQCVVRFLKNSIASQQLQEQNLARELNKTIQDILEQDSGMKNLQSIGEKTLTNMDSAERNNLWK